MKSRTILFALAAMAVAVMSADVAEAGRRGCREPRCRRDRCGLICRWRSRCCETHEVHCEVPVKGYVQAPQVQAPGKPIQGPPTSGLAPTHPTAPTVGNPSAPRQDLNAPPIAPAR